MNERTTIDPDICNGKPTVKSTRITVQTIIETIPAGDTADDALDEYPTLQLGDITARLQFWSNLRTPTR